jgi:hypothetical protein
MPDMRTAHGAARTGHDDVVIHPGATVASA